MRHFFKSGKKIEKEKKKRKEEKNKISENESFIRSVKHESEWIRVVRDVECNVKKWSENIENDKGKSEE